MENIGREVLAAAPPAAQTARQAAGGAAAAIRNLIRATSMSESRERDVEKVYSTGQFVDKLRRLADALEQGKPFPIQVAGQKLKVPADAAISVEHQREGASHELEFQLTWTESAG